MLLAAAVAMASEETKSVGGGGGGGNRGKGTYHMVSSDFVAELVQKGCSKVSELT